MISSFQDVGVINYWVTVHFCNLCWWAKPRVRPQRLPMWLWSRDILIYRLKNSKPPHSKYLDELFCVFFSRSPWAWELLKRQKSGQEGSEGGKDFVWIHRSNCQALANWELQVCEPGLPSTYLFQYWSTALPCFICFSSGGQHAIIGFLPFN